MQCTVLICSDIISSCGGIKSQDTTKSGAWLASYKLGFVLCSMIKTSSLVSISKPALVYSIEIFCLLVCAYIQSTCHISTNDRSNSTSDTFSCGHNTAQYCACTDYLSCSEKGRLSLRCSRRGRAGSAIPTESTNKPHEWRARARRAAMPVY